MSEITEFLMYTCDIDSQAHTTEDDYGTPELSGAKVNVICYKDSPKENQSYNSNGVKIDAILFLEPDVVIKNGYIISNIMKGAVTIDSKDYKVISIEPLIDDEGLHHIEANMQILG